MAVREPFLLKYGGHEQSSIWFLYMIVQTAPLGLQLEGIYYRQYT